MSTFTIDTPALRRFGERAATQICEAGAEVVLNAVKLQMEPGPVRAGETYRVPSTKTPYKASAPGQPPAVREGVYFGSWHNTKAVRRGDIVVARTQTDLKVGPNEEYVLGVLLEHGTEDLVNYQVRMEPRPHARPAFDEAQGEVRDLVRIASR